jgi:hypothetical protein
MIFLILTLMAVAIFIVGLGTLKYVGLEGLICFQMIYYCQMLINTWSKIPIGLSALYYLKFSVGYNLYDIEMFK